MMSIINDVFWLPKDGNSVEEYEDAAWPSRHLTVRCNDFRAAVADGATETSFSTLWASLLVKAYGLGHFEKCSISDGLARSQELWARKVTCKPLPWYAEQKLESGAFAAIAGVSLQFWGYGANKWNALAVGDCCMFLLRCGRLLLSFPLEKPDDFNSRPALISSKPENNSQLREHTKSRSGFCHAGDTICLMSDALACWFLRRMEDFRHNVIEQVLLLRNNMDFAELVGIERKNRDEDRPRLKNDDVTLVRCSLVD